VRTNHNGEVFDSNGKVVLARFRGNYFHGTTYGLRGMAINACVRSEQCRGIVPPKPSSKHGRHTATCTECLRIAELVRCREMRFLSKARPSITAAAESETPKRTLSPTTTYLSTYSALSSGVASDLNSPLYAEHSPEKMRETIAYQETKIDELRAQLRQKLGTSKSVDVDAETHSNITKFLDGISGDTTKSDLDRPQGASEPFLPVQGF